MNTTQQQRAERALALRRDWHALGSWSAVAEKHSSTPTAVAKYWSEVKAALNLSDPVTNPQIMDASIEEVSQEADPDNDWQQWRTAMIALPRSYRIAFATDLHIPDHDPRAVELACKIIEDFQPHVLPHGSDALDFPTIGRWEVDPEEVTTDVWQQINRPYLQIKRQFKSAAPTAKNPFIVGNHDVRVYDFMTRQAPQFRYTIQQLFIDMVRKAGGLWLGWDAVELDMPGVLLTHGTRVVSGVYPARRLADYCGFQVSALAGHVHRFDAWTRRGAKTIVTYQTSGCLCNLQPHYASTRQNWQQGIVLATVSDGTAFFEAVPFTNYKAVWGGKEFRA